MMTFRMNGRGVASLGLAALFLAAPSCTNLTEVPHDALTPQNAFHSDAEILAGVAGVYATLRSVDGNSAYESMQDLTTDVSVVPIRGSDWLDNGQWLDMHKQTYTANSAGILNLVNGEWNDMFGAIAKENLMIDVITKANSGAKGDTTLAELETLRAWDYYMLQDLFGGVPLVTTTELKQYPRASRDSIFRFIESSLLSARDRLPAKWPDEYSGRVTKGAANAILASLYLNAGVFTKDGAQGGINPTGYNSCSGIQVSGGKDACQAAIDAADAVINSGQYSLAANWGDNFSPTNKNAPGNIFVIVHVTDKDLGGNWPMRTLHYNQLSNGWGGPWNGFATTAENFARFTNTDDRRSMWLVGPAKNFEGSSPVKDRAGNPLIFTTTIANLNAATEGEGVRFNKFPPLPDLPTGDGFPNDYPFFRLAEMYLIKAEAENELNQTAAALADLAVIHDRHDAANPVAAMGLTSKDQIRAAILTERALEFSGEGKRRSDMIRHGKFTTWTESSANGIAPNRDGHVILFPIPAPQIASNPQLTQNPGYGG